MGEVGRVSLVAESGISTQEGTHEKGRGSQTEVHVQFFDQPVSRGWVKEK